LPMTPPTSPDPRRPGRSPTAEDLQAPTGRDGPRPGAASGAASGAARGLEQIAGHPLPPRLAEAEDPGVAAWRDDLLPGLVEGLLSEWALTTQAPFTPGGSTAWVAPVTGPGDTELVLKVAWAHGESRDEAVGLAAWQGYGAVRVLHAELRGQSSLLLMDRVRPGTPLSQSLSRSERDEVVAAVLNRLWSAPVPPGTALRPLASMCAWWADEAAHRLTAAPTRAARHEEPVLPAGLIEHGLGQFRQLPLEWDGEPVLLATDLHPDNVLLSRPNGRGALPVAGGIGNVGADVGSVGEVGADAGSVGGADMDGPGTDEVSWVLIDPKPYLGDPHYDVLQHMFNDVERLRADPSGFAERMARLTGLDPHRVRRWLLARCVQEAAVMEGATTAALRLAADGVR